MGKVRKGVTKSKKKKGLVQLSVKLKRLKNIKEKKRKEKKKNNWERERENIVIELDRIF